jgi:hypothetical protein
MSKCWKYLHTGFVRVFFNRVLSFRSLNLVEITVGSISSVFPVIYDGCIVLVIVEILLSSTAQFDIVLFPAVLSIVAIKSMGELEFWLLSSIEAIGEFEVDH